MQAFLVIEPNEVRLEVLLRAGALEEFDRFKAIDGKKTIEPEAQEAFIADLLALMRDKSGVIIDGKKATPSFERGEFVAIGSWFCSLSLEGRSH